MLVVTLERKSQVIFILATGLMMSSHAVQDVLLVVAVEINVRVPYRKEETKKSKQVYASFCILASSPIILIELE